MREHLLLRLLLSLLLVCLLQTTGWGAGGYDDCLKEEQSLHQAEAEACSGLSYIVNPSGCFNTRKLLSPYDRGKCRELAISEGVVEPKAEPPRPAAAPAAVAPVAAGAPATSGAAERAIAELKKEVAALREEIGLLKKEIAGLKGQQK